MPWLKDISYSREECIAAIRDYYDFLSKMYLDKSALREPPTGGWPSITSDSLKELDKTDEVIALLRQLPYMPTSTFFNIDEPHVIPYGRFEDWENMADSVKRSVFTSDDLKLFTEEFYTFIPPQVIGLVSGSREHPVILLDTQLGVIYWPECWGGIREDSSGAHQICDDALDYAPDNEVDWRIDGGAWAISDFFEMLKQHFRDLHFIPISPRQVKDIWTSYGGMDGWIQMVQGIYRDHGWPDLEKYRKEDCLKAIHEALKERYPGFED
jgi:hypothetical protein